MMPVTSFAQPTTSVSLASSAPTANTTTAVQSGPYTKAQFLNTMEGSRSVKNIKEVEQLLRDYPAALELYRTKRYKVKVKYEADVERVILVEKRSSKSGSSSAARNADAQQQKPATQEAAGDVKQTRSESKRSKDPDKHRSRTHSNDRTAPVASSTVNEAADAAQTVPNNVASTTSASRRASKEHEALTNSQSKPDQVNLSRREQSHDSRSVVSHTKSKGKKHSRDYPTALVPYVPQANAAANMQQSRALQPYYNNSLYPQQQLYPQNYYVPPALMPPQNSMYQSPYYYPQQQPYPLTYQQQPPYSAPSQSKSAGSNHNSAVNSPHNYPQASRNAYDQNPAPNLPPTFHTFHPAQQYYSYPQPNLYPQQQSTPFQLPTGWPSPSNFPGQHVVTPNQGYSDSRRGSKHRAYSVDMGPRGVPPVATYPQPQQYPAAAAVEQHYSHHRTHHHHHHRSHPAETQVTNVAPPVELASQPAAVSAPVSVDNNNEKLTIRQLNEMFVQVDPSGRLAYNSVPVFLQRFGMTLAENDLISAAQQLNYNVAEPISARRLVHVLVKLGKIAKSTNQPRPHPFAQPQQQQPLASPGMLPEDREVTDIMTQQRTPDAPSTHIHSSIYPNHWY